MALAYEIKETECVESKDCGRFEVELNHHTLIDDEIEWEVKIMWNDGAIPTTLEFDTYDLAQQEYKSWGV